MKTNEFHDTCICSISDNWTYKGMRVIWLENSLIRIGIFADRGSDIFEFTYKPLNMNMLLRIPGRLRNLTTDFSQMRSTANQFEDHYYGGWQECLPNSPSFTYRGASLGQHGEISLIPWKYSILEMGPDLVSVKLWGSPVRLPLRIEKTISLSAGKSEIEISEKLVNLGNTKLDVMWGHHVAFGLPFLKEGVQIQTNARHIIAEPLIPNPRRFKPGITTEWPNVVNVDGQEDRADQVPDIDAPAYSDLAYLSGFDKRGKYSIQNLSRNISFSLDWDAEIFKYVWYWTERYGTVDSPWWGECYAVALEPWTSKWTDQPEEAIEKGEWLQIEAKQTIGTSLVASISEIE